jgi:hypothetical protein
LHTVTGGVTVRVSMVVVMIMRVIVVSRMSVFMGIVVFVCF